MPRALGSVLGLETKIPQTMQCNQKKEKKKKKPELDKTLFVVRALILLSEDCPYFL